MEVSPKDGTTVVLPDVPPGNAYWLNADSAGDLAAHPEVVAAFDAGAKAVLVVGPDFEMAQAQETERVRSLIKTEPSVFQGEPPSVDEVIAMAKRLAKSNG